MTDSQNSRIPVQTQRFVSPGLVDVIKRGAEGVITDEGGIQLDDIRDVELELVETDALSAGTRVYVKYRRGDVFCQPMTEREREQAEKKQRYEYEQLAKAHLKDRNREHAAAFWDGYEIPFEWDVAQKGVRSELQRGSTGTGQNARSVTHLYIRESFEGGRLVRDADRYLCTDESEFRFEGVQKTDSSGDEYRPPVTCSTCLEFMERWETMKRDL